MNRSRALALGMMVCASLAFMLSGLAVYFYYQPPTAAGLAPSGDHLQFEFRLNLQSYTFGPSNSTLTTNATATIHAYSTVSVNVTMVNNGSVGFVIESMMCSPSENFIYLGMNPSIGTFLVAAHNTTSFLMWFQVVESGPAYPSCVMWAVAALR